MASMGVLAVFSTAFWGWTQLPTSTFGLSALFPVLSSHHILVGLSLPMVRGGERTKPQYGERVSKNRPHVHPLSFFCPSSLFLFQLLYALKMRDNQTSVGGAFTTQSVIITKTVYPVLLVSLLLSTCATSH